MGVEIDRLEVQIESKATKVNNSLDTLVSKLDRVSGALSNLNSDGLANLSKGVVQFSQASAQLSNVKTSDFTRLSKNIEKLSNLNTRQLYGASHAMRTLSNSMNSFGSVSGNSAGVAQFASGISKLGGVGVQRAIANLPLLATALKDFMAVIATAPVVSRNIIQMTDALASLAAQGSKVGTVSNSLTQDVNRVGNAMSANTKKVKSFASVIGSLYQIYFWVSKAIEKLWPSIEESMSYIENLNYFNSAFGQVAEKADLSAWEEAGSDSAEAYYNSFSERAKELTSKMTGFNINEDGTLTATGDASLGINPSKMMNYQAMFAQMSSSMGVASETSLKLSQALTEIGADLASVKNMDFDKVWTDMASGLAGMSRTLDKYGVNIRNVNLQQKLFDLGINENITNLNQNDKALLRTIILLDSTRYAWGDLADTLNQPANQMRLLESNISNLSRTVGNLFLPMISKVLPYVNGLVIALQRLATWIGNLMGIDLSEITSGIGSSEVDIGELLGDADDLAGSLDDASDAAKKLKSNLQGFDELNVITTQQDTSGLGNAGGISSGLLDGAFEDAFSEYQKAWDEAFENMENRANVFADNIEKFFQPVKDIINDFSIGDYFNAGKDTSKLVSGIFNFFSDAIDDVDWDKIGEDIGDYLAGIEWLEVIKSGFALTQNISDALAELWFGSLEEAPFETLIGTFLVGLSITASPKVVLAPVFAWQAGFSIGRELGKLIDPDATEFYIDFKWFDESGFFDTIKNTDFDILADAFEQMSTDIINNPIYRFLTGTFVLPKKRTSHDIKEEWETFVNDLKLLGESISTWGEDYIVKPFGMWGDAISEWWNNGIAPVFTKEKWLQLGENAKSALSDKWSEFTVWWESTGLYKWWTEKVAPYFSKEAWSWSGIKDGLSDAWNGAIEAIKKLWNKFAEWLNAKLTINIDTSSIIGKGISEILGTSSLSLGVIPTFSVGGFPEDGLFMANHSELVGKFSNGKTAVANNQQITEGIAIAVHDGNYEQNELLREQNQLLRAILEKEVGISTEDIGKSARKYAQDFYRRTGNEAYSF